MAVLVLVGFVLLVAGLAWFTSQKEPRASGCCAPADPRGDVRMRSAYDTELGGTSTDGVSGRNPPRPPTQTGKPSSRAARGGLPRVEVG